MATIQNARDVLLQAAATRLETVAGPSNVTLDFAQVTGTTRPANNADVTTSILTSSGTSIVMNNAQLFKSGSGAGGVFIGSGGLFGRNSGGAETFAIDAGTGAVRFTGTISGGSDINIIGQARFRGAYNAGGYTAAVQANESGASAYGVVGRTFTSGAAGVLGLESGGGSSASAVFGSAGDGMGVKGVSSSGAGGSFQSASGPGMYCTSSSGPAAEFQGSFKWQGYTWAPPSGSSTACFHNDGVWRDPVTTARVNAAFGCSKLDVLQLAVCDVGTAIVGGSGLNLVSLITGVRFRASGNIIYLEGF